MRFVVTMFALLCLGIPGVRAQDAPLKRLIVVPPLQWDSTAMSPRPGIRQMPSDFAKLTGGIIFGMQPHEVNALLVDPGLAREWYKLPLAPEFPEDVRYFWIKIGAAGILDSGISGCVGEASYLVFLFRARGLFRISYRFIPDSLCPSLKDAASAVMARYATIEPELALATHYRNGNAEVVDIVDPGSGHLRTIRWQQRRR